MNKHNKCISSKSLNRNEIAAIQSNCVPGEKQQLWKWNGNSLCNDLSQCVTKGKRRNLLTNKETPLYLVQLKPLHKDKLIDQNWRALAVQEQVFQLASSSDGLCLGVFLNLDSRDAHLAMDNCDKREKGQFWSFASA